MIKSIRGTVDLFPDQKRLYNFITETGRKVCGKYGYRDMSTPIIEPLELFTRSVGTESDIVMKEMYNFKDQGGSMTCLRPEGTAGLMRAFINDFNHTVQLPQRFFYAGPMFRYERPQRGRQRQFEQLGCELIGEDHYLADVESIETSLQFLDSIGIDQSKIQLKINSLGDEESRSNYLKSLKEYYASRLDQLSADSKTRFERGNFLRILDSKDENDRLINQQAPNILDFLNVNSNQRFKNILLNLEKGNINYEIDQGLVRGLDYYSHTIFEVVTKSNGDSAAAAAASPPLALLGGGRYDSLAKQLGYKGGALPSIGWACGMERLILNLGENVVPKERLPLFLVTNNSGLVDDQQKEALTQQSLDIVRSLRKADQYVMTSEYQLLSGGNISKQLKRVSGRYQSRYVIVVNSESLQNQTVSIKDMLNHSQSDQIPINTLDQQFNKLNNQ
ncbi:histidine-tRNA ligase [Cavenderia fasciculata]|uniref:histidine--tRNA ligase n=1 Tax=Cavenderia fasciculata TaxID=261658 RepID=F4PHA8_CACFS|nr:histidine-tRNA ligase [Cavenderia fasciculata]EGG25092.1 histidine-tRNA ligase [Cavenderia fasciculata]|eukprot:XP_004362943.1 histidine-tRNA ligase [Cavenderia fasciculata]